MSCSALDLYMAFVSHASQERHCMIWETCTERYCFHFLVMIISLDVQYMNQREHCICILNCHRENEIHWMRPISINGAIVYYFSYCFCLSPSSVLWKPRGALFLDLFRSCTFRQSPIVVDCRRLSPKVAARRRLSPIRDRKIRAMKIKFANALWPTCAKCACEKLTFELSLDNDVKRPQDGPFGW